MQRAQSPYAAAGVALATAGAIALSPLAPPAPEVHLPALSSAAVELTAATDPFTAWVDVFGTAFANLTQLGETLAANPAPVLQQIGANWLGYGETYISALQAAGAGLNTWAQLLPTAFQGISDSLAAGDLIKASTWLNGLTTALGALAGTPMLRTLTIPRDIAQNLANAATAIFGTMPALIPTLGFAVLAQINLSVTAVATSGQVVVDAMKAGDTAAALSALINMPADVTDRILNGYVQTLPDGATRRVGGLLQQPGPIPGSTYKQAAGFLYKLLVDTPQTIAKAIGWEAPVTANTTAGLLGPAAAPAALASASTIPDTSSATAVTLSTEPAPTTSKPEANPMADTIAKPDGSTATDTPNPDPAKQPAVSLVRESLAASPTKTGATPTADKPAAKVASDVRDGVSATAKKIGEGVKKAFSKPDKTAKADTAKSNAGSGSAGKHRATSDNSGDSK
ncbi:hypothetical protein [Mycolicibacterium porcinum]